MNISILTPSFNRRHTLRRLWESLCSQQDPGTFEWVLVDDGSTDGTKQWFEALQKHQTIEASYFRQPNQGKHVAINTAISLAHGDWVLILDSDDALTADALVTIRNDLGSLNNTSQVVGLSYRKIYFNGETVGNTVIETRTQVMKPNDAGAIFQGDLAYVFKREVLTKHPFPVISGEKFVPELLMWNRISDDGDIYYHPRKAIYLCEYLPDGYSANFNRTLRDNPKGFGLFYRDQLRRLSLGKQWLKAFMRFLQCQFFSRTKS